MQQKIKYFCRLVYLKGTIFCFELVLALRPGHEIVERCARFSIEIQDNFKLISVYPSDLPGFRLSEVVRWPAFKNACAAAHRLLKQLEGQASKFIFGASAKSMAERSARVRRAQGITDRCRVSDSQGGPQPAHTLNESEEV